MYCEWKWHNANFERNKDFRHTVGARSCMWELAFNVTSVSSSLKLFYMIIILQLIVIINVIRRSVTKWLVLKFWLCTQWKLFSSLVRVLKSSTCLVLEIRRMVCEGGLRALDSRGVIEIFAVVQQQPVTGTWIPHGHLKSPLQMFSDK
jgi:hypothetical protein